MRFSESVAALAAFFGCCACTVPEVSEPSKAAPASAPIRAASGITRPPLPRRADLPPAALAVQIASPRPVDRGRSALPPDPGAGAGSARPGSPGTAEARPRRRAGSLKPHRLRVRTTAFARDEADHFSFGSMSAMGTPLRLGAVRSAAADWSRFPAGTRFRIAGDPAVYEIDDYGSALVGGETIDLYQRDEIEMDEWGVRHVDIEIERWGSPERSLAILEPRAGHAHVDAMIRDLRSGRHLKKKGK